MRDTVKDMGKEMEQKDDKIEFLKNKIGLPDCKIVEQKNKMGLNKTSWKEKVL